MKPFKGKFTENTFRVVNAVPFLFPKWLREISEHYKEPDDGEIFRREDNIQYGNFLDGDFLWKAVSITVQLDHSELELLHKWMQKSASPMDYNPSRDSGSFKVNYDRGGGYRSLGWININRNKTMTSLATVQHNSSYCSSCYTTLDTLSHGFSYVTIYMMLTEEATKKINNVKTESIQRYKSFQTLNPFSKRFKIIQHHDRYNQINKLIEDNFNNVVSDCKEIAIAILRMWKINKSESELISVADFYRDCQEPYFYSRDQRVEKHIENDTSQVLIDKYKLFCDINISNNSNEHYCENRFDKELNVNAYYILSQPESEFEDYNNYKRIGLTTNGSHIFFSLVHDLLRQYKEISDSINPILIQNRNTAEKNHSILYNTLLKIERLKENINSVENRIAFECPEKYHKAAKDHINHIKSITNKLRNAVKQRKEYSRDSLDLRNLYFHKKYSYIVGFLVIVQIALAGLTIDWDKKIKEIVSCYENITNQSSRPPSAAAD